MSDTLLSDLTPPQREAVVHMDGPMLVVAGAGSGKTRVVTRRIAHLIGRGVPPRRILALTFTNKAAREMRGRIEKLVGEAPSWMGTFHAVCARLLRRDIGLLGDGRDSKFSILDQGDQESLVKAALKRLSAAGKENRPAAVLSRISRIKSDFVPPEGFQPESWRDEIVGQIYAEYERALRAMNAVDFDDLLILAARLLEHSPAALARYQSWFHYLLVDEYQDTNRAQYRLLQALAGSRANLHATGDPDQSIYSWRGADYRNIMDFQSDYPGARLIRLEENYRSGRFILDAANPLIRHNLERLDKDLFTSRPGGEKVRLVRLQSDRMEAMWVGDEAGRLLAGGANPGEVAIFYRTNAQSRPLEEIFVNRNIPYQLVGGVRFYDRREVRDLLAQLRLRVNPRDIANLRRTAASRPGIGEKTLERIAAAAAEAGVPAFSFLADPGFAQCSGLDGRSGKKAAEFARWCAGLAGIGIERADRAVREILGHSGLLEALQADIGRDELAEERIENLYSLAARAEEFVRQRTDGDREGEGAAAGREAAEPAPAADLPAFLEDVALVADVDNLDSDASRITLMTLHNAKGLEFDDVFLVGLEDGLLPHRNAASDAAVAEERRLFYVGLTRARKRAWVSHAASRALYGSLELQPPSRFLGELPETALERFDFADSLSGECGSGFLFRSGGVKRQEHRLPAKDPAGGDLFDLDIDIDADFDPNPGFQPEPDPGFPDEPAPAGPGAKFGRKPERRQFRIGISRPAGDPPARFKPGDLVRHPLFGSGKVLSAEKQKIMVQFFVSGTRVLAADMSQLRRQ
jgi:DNA helicase-2/ATP-dependent DNA helicase PcrA